MSEDNGGTSQFRMMIERRFAPLWLCNTLGEFSNQLTRAGDRRIVASYTMSTATAGELRGLAAIIFVIPAILSAPYAGQLADRMEGHRLIRLSRLLGIAGALAAALGISFGVGWAVIGGLCATAVQASIFGPARGVLIRKHLSDRELTGGNGLMSAGWQLTAVAALTIGLLEPGALPMTNRVMVALLVAAALTAWFASPCIASYSSAGSSTGNSLESLEAMRRTLLPAISERGTFLAILGISWFWFTSLTYMIYLPDYAYTSFGAGRDGSLIMLRRYWSVSRSVR